MRRGRRAAQQDDEQYREIHAEQHDQRDGPQRKARAPLERAGIHQPGNRLALALELRFLECVENE
jgi:hypothetical protein